MDREHTLLLISAPTAAAATSERASASPPNERVRERERQQRQCQQQQQLPQTRQRRRQRVGGEEEALTQAKTGTHSLTHTERQTHFLEAKKRGNGRAGG